MSFIIFVLLFYPNFGLIQIRNGVALAFCWWAIFDLVKEKKLRFIVKTFIATLFHYSSIFLFFIIFFNRNRINKYVYLLLPIVGLILQHYVFKVEFFQSFISYLPTFLKFKAQSYLYLKLYNPEHKLMQINIFNFYSLFILTLYFLSLITFYFYQDKYFITFIKLIGLGIFFWFCFKNIAVFSFRISNSFITFIVFLIPYILESFKRQEKLLVYLLLITILILLSWNIYIRHDLFDFSVL
jgi:hypothetical protein